MKLNESQLRNIIRTSLRTMLKESEPGEMYDDWQQWLPDEDMQYAYGDDYDGEFDEDYDDYMDSQELDECGDLDTMINEAVRDTIKKYVKKGKDAVKKFVNDDSDDIRKCTRGRCKNFGDCNPKMKKIFGKDK